MKKYIFFLFILSNEYFLWDIYDFSSIKDNYIVLESLILTLIFIILWILLENNNPNEANFNNHENELEYFF